MHFYSIFFDMCHYLRVTFKHNITLWMRIYLRTVVKNLFSKGLNQLVFALDPNYVLCLRVTKIIKDISHADFHCLCATEVLLQIHPQLTYLFLFVFVLFLRVTVCEGYKKFPHLRMKNLLFCYVKNVMSLF